MVYNSKYNLIEEAEVRKKTVKFYLIRNKNEDFYSQDLSEIC